MVQCRLNMFHVGYMSVQGSILLDVLSLWLSMPVGSRGNWLSLNSTFLFYQAILKLVTQ